MIAAAVVLIYLRHLNFRWTLLQVVGALAYSSTQLFFIISTKQTTAANAIFLQYTSPIYIVLLGKRFLGERPRRFDWTSLFFILVGLLFCFGDDLTFNEFSGNASGIISSLALAIFVLCMRRQKAGVPANTVLLGNIMNAFVGLPFLLQETFSLPSLGIILYLGLFQVGLSFVLYSIAIKYVKAFESTLILSLELVLNPLWVFLVIGEAPGRFALIGSIFILTAVVASAIASSRETSDDLPTTRLA
jgi:drug/metabolite transporter (DMT)-like permease